jgi:H+-transporting ATPase
MLLASAADVAIVTSLALSGVLMAALPTAIVAALFMATIAFAFVLDAVKITIFSRLRID